MHGDLQSRDYRLQGLRYSILLLLSLQVLMLMVVKANDINLESVLPPSRPSVFRSPDELRTYLMALNDYYTIIGRPRFGRRSYNPPMPPTPLLIHDEFE